MNKLNADTLTCIGYYLGRKDVLSLSMVNKHVRAICEPLLKSFYQRAYGQINATHQVDKVTLLKLICAV